MEKLETSSKSPVEVILGLIGGWCMSRISPIQFMLTMWLRFTICLGLVARPQFIWLMLPQSTGSTASWSGMMLLCHSLPKTSSWKIRETSTTALSSVRRSCFHCHCCVRLVNGLDSCFKMCFIRPAPQLTGHNHPHNNKRPHLHLIPLVSARKACQNTGSPEFFLSCPSHQEGFPAFQKRQEQEEILRMRHLLLVPPMWGVLKNH